MRCAIERTDRLNKIKCCVLARLAYNKCTCIHTAIHVDCDCEGPQAKSTTTKASDLKLYILIHFVDVVSLKAPDSHVDRIECDAYRTHSTQSTYTRNEIEISRKWYTQSNKQATGVRISKAKSIEWVCAHRDSDEYKQQQEKKRRRNKKTNVRN